MKVVKRSLRQGEGGESGGVSYVEHSSLGDSIVVRILDNGLLLLCKAVSGTALAGC